MHMYHTVMIQSLVYVHLGYFHYLVIVKRAAIIMDMKIFLGQNKEHFGCMYAREWYSWVIW